MSDASTPVFGGRARGGSGWAPSGLARAPSVDEITKLLDIALASMPERQVWVNPDCGLKTRGYGETVESLANILVATRSARATAGV